MRSCNVILVEVDNEHDKKDCRILLQGKKKIRMNEKVCGIQYLRPVSAGAASGAAHISSLLKDNARKTPGPKEKREERTTKKMNVLVIIVIVGS